MFSGGPARSRFTTTVELLPEDLLDYRIPQLHAHSKGTLCCGLRCEPSRLRLLVSGIRATEALYHCKG